MAEGGRSGLGFLLVLWSLGRKKLSASFLTDSRQPVTALFSEVHRYTINDPRFARQTVSSPLRLGKTKEHLKEHQR